MDLPNEILERIFEDVILEAGDSAYLTLSLVAKRFQKVVNTDHFRDRCHFAWLLSKHVFFFFFFFFCYTVIQ